MPRLEIDLFADRHLDEAATLLGERHRRHRAAEPLLPDVADLHAEISALRAKAGAAGVVGIRDGRVVAYLIGTRLSDDVWGPNVWVELAGHACENAEEMRDLYAAAAADWVDEGRTSHYVWVPACEPELVDAWFRLGFGQQHALGIRELPEVSAPVESVREAGPGDVDELLRLAPLLQEHQALSPVFSGGPPPEDPAELRAEIEEDVASAEVGNLVAELDGRIVGDFLVVAVERSSMHTGLARPEGASLLGWAATQPETRGTGLGVALTDASFAWARARGYETMVTDWRVTNLLASRFWPQRGFRTSFLRLYRSVS